MTSRFDGDAAGDSWRMPRSLEGAGAAPAMPAPSRRARVVVLGAGFGGLSAVLGLARAPVDITVVDRRNYHLFQPLLYQVATAGLAPSDIASPIRGILRRQQNVRVLMARVRGVDLQQRRVLFDRLSLPYDYLVVATGSRDAYFGHDDWEDVAPGLKKIDDATDLRRRILSAFERAESTDDPVERQRQLSFVVVGAGATGVELAGAIAELARHALARDFRRIDTRSARIVIVEAGPRALPAFPETLSAAAARSLKVLGVELRTGARVTAIDAGGVMLGDERIAAATVIWAAGVIASPAAKWLGAEADRAGRAIVGPDLSLPGHPEVYVIGDTAHVRGHDDKPLPGIAPVAKQQGRYVARRIAKLVHGVEPTAAFRYRHLGHLATLGRRAAVADFGFLRLSSWPAWWLWGLVHVYFLIGFRNRLVVLLDWFWAYLTFQQGSRLITGSEGES